MLAVLLGLAVAAGPAIEPETIAITPGGREVRVVKFRRGPEPCYRALVVGRQHGDEPAGGEALSALVRKYTHDPAAIPEGLELWVVPALNPDGAAGHKRRNDAGADLNRDHLLLRQPETAALHRLARELDPHLVVDLHEFTRDSADYRARGWSEWPLVMMDTANHPLLDDALYRRGLARVEAARGALAGRGIPYRRYHVGGAPPAEEQRPSTLEADDARNGLALGGALSFIVESGISRTAADPDADLGRRVEAHLVLLEGLLAAGPERDADAAAVEAARRVPLPPFLPVNTMWGNASRSVVEVEVVQRSDGAVLRIPTANFLLDRVTKRSVATPLGYAVTPAGSGPFRALLERHGVPFERLESPRTVALEAATLVRFEEDDDAVHGRYGGRQVVVVGAAEQRTLEPGTLWVPLEGRAARRAASLLEPTMLYGVYADPEFRALAGDGGTLPVVRVVASPSK